MAYTVAYSLKSVYMYNMVEIKVIYNTYNVIVDGGKFEIIV